MAGDVRAHVYVCVGVHVCVGVCACVCMCARGCVCERAHRGQSLARFHEVKVVDVS